MSLFSLQPLEPRRLLSTVVPTATPPPTVGYATMAAASVTPADLLTKAVRQTLVNHWNGTNKADLQAKLDAGKMGAFDDLLLSYLKARTGQTFFWKTSDVSGIVSFINTNLDAGPTISHADDIIAHRFPEQGNSDTYAIQLPAGSINWSTLPTTTSSPEFLQTLNRQEFWLDLAQAYRATGDSKYITELTNQLASWSQQNPALADPNSWGDHTPHWNPLDTALRATSWTWTYQMVLGSSGWTGAANTLFLSKLWETGDFLRRVNPYALTSNRSLFEGKGLLQVAQLMPEFLGAPAWETYARKLLFGAMDAQVYPDGGHIEQSPGYAVNVISDLLEAYWLDQLKGNVSAWPAERSTRLYNAMKSHIQLLSPNGALAALSDTYRTTAVPMLTKAQIILSTTDEWPGAKPRLRDVWLFGDDAMGPYLSKAVYPSLGDRGSSYAMTDSGYYVMRSGADTNARQVTFDAGPTGGVHGHFDLLNFELFGYGKPLISDPGLYKYDTSANRNYVISTRAHNTINVDGDSHAALEGDNNPSIVVDQWTADEDHAQVAAHHFGYNSKDGSPVVGRSIWYDYSNTMLIVDWGEASSSHAYQVSYNLPGDSTTVSGVQPDGSFHTKYGSGNVEVSPLLRTGQIAARGAATFVSNEAPPNEADPAYRFTITGTGKFQVFATLVTTYSGTTPPNISAEWVTTSPEAGQPVVLRLTKNGVSQDITFAAPQLTRPPANLASANGSANDLAWDGAGRLHMVYFDRLSRNLKYTVRDTSGKWGIVQTIDPSTDAGVYVSLALDSNGKPGVAYFDGNNGDLKYAKLTNGAWDIQTVDGPGSVGLYPSLVFSRGNGAIITYYNRSKGDLRMAGTVTGGWSITAIDTAGDVGRFSSIQLDPNRPDVSKVAVAYEDTTNGDYKYAIQYKTGWKIQSVDTRTTIGGGYVSMQFQPYTSADGTYHPTVSYYDAGNSALKFAEFDGEAWQNQTVVSAGKIGLYTGLVYDVGQRPNIFFFNKSSNKAYRAVFAKHAWSFILLGVGGREMNVARRSSGALAYSTLDDTAPLLEVGFLGS